MSSATVVKSERIAARVTPAQKRLVERAALAEGVTAADFTVAAAVGRAREIVLSNPSPELDEDAWKRFCAILDEPPEPMDGLVELLRRPSVFAD
jgi:uncharacterized protein (DUF1778 family)